MFRPRLLFGSLFGVALLAVPAVVLAATLSVTGTGSGTATTLAPTAGATCNPPGATQPSDYICDSTVAGTFVLSQLGSGTYSGNVRLDWSTWTSAEPCAAASGAVTFMGADDSIATALDTTSRVCETMPASDTFTMSLDLVVSGGTGRFAPPSSGSFEETGFLVETATPGNYTSTQSIQGSITVADPTPTATPTVTAAPSASATPTASATPGPTASPDAATMPDTSTGGIPGPGLLVVIGLGVVVLASTSYGVMKGAAAR